MVDFEKLFIASEVVPVDPEVCQGREAGEFFFDPGQISLAEFDLGGVLYHANYFHLYERAKEALLADLGMPYPVLARAGYHLAVVETEQHFYKPIYYGMSVGLGMRCQELKSASLTFAYTIYSHDEILHEAFTRHAFVKKDESGSFKPSRLPKQLVAAMVDRFTF